jgi:hypothetical protein
MRERNFFASKTGINPANPKRLRIVVARSRLLLGRSLECGLYCRNRDSFDKRPWLHFLVATEPASHPKFKSRLITLFPKIQSREG